MVYPPTDGINHSRCRAATLNETNLLPLSKATTLVLGRSILQEGVKVTIFIQTPKCTAYNLSIHDRPDWEPKWSFAITLANINKDPEWNQLRSTHPFIPPG